MNRFHAALIVTAASTACINQMPPPPHAVNHTAHTSSPSHVVDLGGVGVNNDIPSDGDNNANPPPDSTPLDDAAIVSAALPSSLDCGASATATVTVENRGTATWTKADGYRLGAVDDSDPFAPGRIELDDGDAVAPGARYTFTIAMNAPAMSGTYTSDWRMVHELVDWFGDTTSSDVAVVCDAPPPPPPPPPPSTDPAGFAWSTVTIKNSPDVSTWSESAKITGLELAPDGVHIDFTKRDGDASWPDVPFGDGGSLEYTLWIVINVDGAWYASGCIEYWRGLDKNGGPPDQYAANWYYDSFRWGAMTGHQPAVGETVGFLVSQGDARNDGINAVNERSNIVWVQFPDANGASFTF